jgi:succinate dehydrogenase/fumarate reductase cytochrome b subunit
VRKINTIISTLLLGLFIFHAIAGGYQMIGVMPGGSDLMETVAWILILLTAVHMLFGIVLTVKTVQISKRTGIHYWKENSMFWLRRLSGFVLMLLIFLHLILFVRTGEGIFRLSNFDVPQLIGQILMLLALMLHLLCNIRPLAVALGLYGGRGYVRDAIFIISVVLAFCGLAFVVYYLRWNVWWR